ncbi:MAG: HIT family protein [Candidatus Woesearchaeota archaeon]
MCLFCKIAKGEIPSAKVYEDDEVLAFLDIAPVHPGHCLVIPKEHYVTMVDIPSDLLQKVIAVTKMCAKGVMDATGCDGFNISQNNFRASGQAIDHLHFHVIPRFEGDGLKLWPQGSYKDGEIEEIAESIKKLL